MKQTTAPAEYDRIVKQVEEYTCFRMTARVDDGSAFFVPVAKDGNVMGDVVQFTWKQIKALAALGPAPSAR